MLKEEAQLIVLGSGAASPGSHHSERLMKLELKLQKEGKEILMQEEMLWKQKSRCDWLKVGDGNTQFFTLQHWCNEDGT